MEKIKILFRWLRFYLKANTIYRVHSPFVFDFTENILEDRRSYYAFDEVEALRAQLARDTRSIDVTDYGAGSHTDRRNMRRLRDIAHSALTDKRHGQVLFKIILHYGLANRLEMGTSLGLTAAYLALPLEKGRFITLEGCPNIAQVARENLSALHATNAELRVGEFGQTLPEALKELGRLDFAFFDGNHRCAPTIAYFETCLQFAHSDSVFVFDDIHWSEEMEQAWEHIKAHPKTSLTIDLFFMGIVYFKKDFSQKAHCALVPARWKPWMLGFWAK
jgi:predicted O-methyltransferase YrrM